MKPRSPLRSGEELVNKYLVGDFRLLILVGAIIGSVLVGRMLKSTKPAVFGKG